MKIENLAPLVLSHCIEFLRSRPIGTKYRPKESEFYLDSKMMTRIVRYHGDFRAETTQAETLFFSRIITSLKQMNIIESPIRRETFEVLENNDFRCEAITVRKMKKLDMFKGRPIIGEIKDVNVRSIKDS